jgi:SAM-dependent methyltransferase
VSFQTASALELPFGDGRFDVVLLQHVAMNISDRARLYREIRRVLKPGSRFATFDVVLKSSEPHYPVPWARTPATSFLLTAVATREAIQQCGFRTLAWRDDTEAAKTWIPQQRASGPPFLAKSRRGNGAGLRTALRQPPTKSHERSAGHPAGGVRGRVNQHPIGGSMSPAIILQIHLVLGYVPWLLCFGAYVWPRLKSMDPIEAQRAIATLHSFRFFGLVFMVPGVVGPNLPAGFAAFAAYGDFATGLLAILALLMVRQRPLFWLFVVAFNLVGAVDIIVDYYHGNQFGLPSVAGELGATYAIPIIYVPALMITDVIAFYLLMRPQTKADQAIGGLPAAT